LFANAFTHLCSSLEATNLVILLYLQKEAHLKMLLSDSRGSIIFVLCYSVDLSMESSTILQSQLKIWGQRSQLWGLTSFVKCCNAHHIRCYDTCQSRTRRFELYTTSFHIIYAYTYKMLR